MLPSCSEYIICHLESKGHSEDKWQADVRVAIENKEQAVEWLGEFESLNSLDFRVRKTKPENSSRLVFKVRQIFFKICLVCA